MKVEHKGVLESDLAHATPLLSKEDIAAFAAAKVASVKEIYSLGWMLIGMEEVDKDNEMTGGSKNPPLPSNAAASPIEVDDEEVPIQAFVFGSGDVATSSSSAASGTISSRQTTPRSSIQLESE